MNDLSEVRREIDAIDRALAPLVLRRLRLADDVAAAERAAGLPAADPARERAVLAAATASLPPEAAEAVRRVYAVLFAVSKERQTSTYGIIGESAGRPRPPL